MQVFRFSQVPGCGLLDSDKVLSLACDYKYLGTASTLRIVVGNHVPSKLCYSPISVHVITHTAQKTSRCFVIGVFVPHFEAPATLLFPHSVKNTLAVFDRN